MNCAPICIRWSTLRDALAGRFVCYLLYRASGIRLGLTVGAFFWIEPMALERKDVRLKLDYDMHAAVVAISDALGMLPAEWVEQVIVGIVKKRVHEANLLITSLQSSGSLGTFGDGQGHD